MKSHLQFSIEVTVEALEDEPVVVVTATSLVPPRNFFARRKLGVAGVDKRMLDTAVAIEVEMALRHLVATSGLMRELL